MMKNLDPNKFSEKFSFNDDSEINYIWQITYLDVVTVLLCAMILLSNPEILSISDTKNDNGPLENNREYPLNVEWSILDLNEELRAKFEKEIERGNLFFETGEYEIRMNFSGSIFYNQGSSILLPEGKNIIHDIISKLANWERQDYKIDVEGHTDSTPIETLQFPSNWELSASRASGVVKFFLKSGISSQKLKASGYADSQPLYQEIDEFGKLIMNNQDFNRRIVIRLYFE
ncbi:OmpA/MotB family protein [Algoriphagus marincola]|uniref:OmpA/MotB family protein n=1 Tax=Algoriphagus marincola TaxID=264027 RepID=UPI000423017C|nr:OmpA family protein [Algoriphagus marincola]